ncbi:MAG: hypothetical protein IPN49_11460 [Saprospiraceae bacterium]|nr:hypothetical protein [Saprospiraceae bacterium]MBK8819665.1 hypothetical protein [Saprospiraceae bacterium]
MIVLRLYIIEEVICDYSPNKTQANAIHCIILYKGINNDVDDTIKL